MYHQMYIHTFYTSYIVDNMFCCSHCTKRFRNNKARSSHYTQVHTSYILNKVNDKHLSLPRTIDILSNIHHSTDSISSELNDNFISYVEDQQVANDKHIESSNHCFN